MKDSAEKHSLNASTESAFDAKESPSQMKAATPPPFQLKSAGGEQAKGEESAEPVQMMEGGGSGFVNVGSQSNGIIQKQDPVPTGLLAEYADFSIDELKRDIGGNLYDSIHTVQQQRIASWLANAGIEETRPGRAILEVALGVLAGGIGAALGGVVGGVITSTIARQVTQEFVTGVAESSIEALLGAAQSGLLSLTTPNTGDIASAASGGLAVTAASGLAAYYAEGANLTLLSSKTANVTSFNRASSTYSRGRLIVMHKTLQETYNQLMSDPSAFMQSLTIGYMKLLDEVHLTERSADHDGDTEAERRADMYAEDDTIDEADSRAGSLTILGPLTSIGTWESPHFSIDRSNASGLNEQTRRHLAGAKIADLPFSLSFRFWATTPNPGWFGSSLCKVWFVKRPDGSVFVDLDESWESDSNGWDQGREWLARYAVERSDEMTLESIQANVADGAMKAYNRIKNMRIPSNVMNLDMF